MDAFELFTRLVKLDLLKDSPPWWWEDRPIYIILGAILTQQSRWGSVLESIENLKRHFGEITLEIVANSNLSQFISKCSFHNQKAIRLSLLAENILSNYGSLEVFLESEDEHFLISQKGIGLESAHAILCYACHRPILVVDAYTMRLLDALGVEFVDYLELQRYLMSGIESKLDAFSFGKFDEKRHSYENLAHIYARYHGMIVEFSKRYKLKDSKNIL